MTCRDEGVGQEMMAAAMKISVQRWRRQRRRRQFVLFWQHIAAEEKREKHWRIIWDEVFSDGKCVQVEPDQGVQGLNNLWSITKKGWRWNAQR